MAGFSLHIDSNFPGSMEAICDASSSPNLSKSVCGPLKALSIEEIERGFRSLRENHPPRHDFNSFSFKNITKLDKKLDTEFFYDLGRAGYF